MSKKASASTMKEVSLFKRAGRLFFSVFFFILPVSISAQTDEWTAARQVMQQTTDALLRNLSMDFERYSQDQDAFYGMVEGVVLPAIDMNTFARLALGKYWRSINEAQRLDFVRTFQAMLVRTYGKQLLLSIGREHLDGLKIEYLEREDTPPGRKAQIVRTRIIRTNGEPLDISYALVRREEGWKVFDMIVEGSSMLKQLRQAYTTEIEESGFDALLTRLKKAGAAQGQ